MPVSRGVWLNSDQGLIWDISKKLTKFGALNETFNLRNILNNEFINRRKHLMDELFAT